MLLLKTKQKRIKNKILDSLKSNYPPISNAMYSCSVLRFFAHIQKQPTCHATKNGDLDGKIYITLDDI